MLWRAHIAKKPAAKKLKVYRTSIGFHDAYVAAPTKKAALEAWGSKKDLFARGAAELVTDAALEKAPLALPGTVIKVSRGSVAEQLAALPADELQSRKPKAANTKPVGTQPKKRPARPRPRPSRADLEAAEKAVEIATERQAKALAEIVKQEATLAKERKQLVEKQNAEMDELAGKRDEKQRLYDAAMRAWRE